MSQTQFPIYTTKGDWAAMLIGRFIYNPQGEWIGWIDAQGLVFNVRGLYVGWLNRDFRILSKRSLGTHPRRDPPPRQPRVRLPLSVPLPPMLGDLTYDTIDVFEEAAHRLDPMDMDSVQDIE
jgi:hypothetical protein